MSVENQTVSLELTKLKQDSCPKKKKKKKGNVGVEVGGWGGGGGEGGK